MSSEREFASKFDELRRQAKELLRHRTHPVPETPFDIFELIQELQIHQAEIEIQNEELQRAQQELASLHREYETLYELAPCGYVTLNRKGLITRANLAAAELLGIRRALLLRFDFGSFVARGWQDTFLTALREAGKGGEKKSLELALQKQEPPLWVRADIEADRDEEGAVEQWRVVLTDISERKLLEAETEKYQAQQLQAQKMASVGRLAEGVAHEFNNLLQGMLGNVELLHMKKPPDHPDNKYLQQFYSHIFRAKEIVDALLATSSESAMNVKIMDLNLAVQDALSFLKGDIPGNIRLTARLAPDPAYIEADPEQISKMIIKLINNACEAIPAAKGGSIEIRTEPERTSFAAPWRSGEEPSVRLSISDSGVGMSSETQKDIFDFFFTTKGVGEGTGLGLSSVYNIVHLFGGKINVSSQPDHGSRFDIHFPEKRPEGRDGAPWESQAPEHSTPAEKATILVVEDEQDIRDILSEFLKLQGFAVIEAKDGESANREFQENKGRIELIVLDLGIPGMDGEELIGKIKQLQATPKIIVASGYTNHKMASDPQEFGVSSFLCKPFNLQDALHTIRAVLSEG